ncbi:MAG: His/Gly/Thr/Pro-type tRNA ligase C-terminal domain-containing protein, partial [bacterium]
RFIGILIEHFAGAFPVWLSPVQIRIIPISDDYLDYAKKIHGILNQEQLRVEVDERNEKIGYKIREAETHKIPYMLIVGKEEVTNDLVAVRKRRQGDLGKFNVGQFIAIIKKEIHEKHLN